MNEFQKAAAILGKKGGESGTGKAKARSTEEARSAAERRWGGIEGKKQRFWSKVKKGGPDECWPWTGVRFRTGYGCVNLFGRNLSAHRVSFFFTFGHLDATKVICHKCDNPPCCNPNHLWEGTMRDNIRDSVRKGRNDLKIGTKNGNSKLDEPTVLGIRKAVSDGTMGIKHIANQHRVDRTTIWQIVTRKTWKHI